MVILLKFCERLSKLSTESKVQSRFPYIILTYMVFSREQSDRIITCMYLS